MKFALFIGEKGAKISANGQTCGWSENGLFNPKSMEEEAILLYCKMYNVNTKCMYAYNKKDGYHKMNRKVCCYL